VENPHPCRETDAEAIKDCIRRNEHVAITLYRDFAPAAINTQSSASSNLPYFQDRLAIARGQPLRREIEIQTRIARFWEIG